MVIGSRSCGNNAPPPMGCAVNILSATVTHAKRKSPPPTQHVLDRYLFLVRYTYVTPRRERSSVSPAWLPFPVERYLVNGKYRQHKQVARCMKVSAGLLPSTIHPCTKYYNSSRIFRPVFVCFSLEKNAPLFLT